MSHQSDKAKWDALAEMLGAEVSQAGGPPQPRQEKAVVPRVQVDLPPPPRKKADWNSLASDLGAEVEHAPEQPTKSPPRETPVNNERERRSEASPPSTVHHPGRIREEEEEEEEVGKPAEQARGESDAEHEATTKETDGRTATTDRTANLDGERRPSRRRRRRGQRQSQDAATTTGDRLARRDDESESAELKPSEQDLQEADVESSDGRKSARGAKRGGHKSVPSWAEAISLMIDGNLANRSTRRRSGPNGGRSRGRRGGRRA